MQSVSLSQIPEAPLSASVDRVLQRLATLSDSKAIRALSGNELLMERAWLSGASFQSGRSTNGTTRLLSTRDGVLAVGLVRPEDWELLPAWLESSETALWREGEDAWQRLAAELAKRETRSLIEQGRTLGLPLAATGTHRDPLETGFAYLLAERPHTERRSARPPRVIDLTALWAGPLSTHLLHHCGADVIKVESSRRPDGARNGNPAFYDLMNQGKRSVALDLSRVDGRHTLARLIQAADIVVEASRPRALRQMGISAEELLARNPELIWLSITGYGRGEPEANWVAFGDDAGVAAGLSDLMRSASGRYQFAGDAIADPLTGSHAALAAWSAWTRCQGGMIDLSLAHVTAWCLAEELAIKGEAGLAQEFDHWWESVAGNAPLPEYQGRPIIQPVAGLGVHTNAVLEELARPC